MKFIKERIKFLNNRNPFVNQVFVVCLHENRKNHQNQKNRNPFVNQVFVVLCAPSNIRELLAENRNPFVNQVFVVSETVVKNGKEMKSQSLRKSGLCRLITLTCLRHLTGIAIPS